MPSLADGLRVHLDHLIRRQSIRYLAPKEDGQSKPDSTGPEELVFGQEDRGLRYADIKDDKWISQIRKPDFQRETNAWTPEDCVAFLDSVVYGRIIPSIILWHSHGNALIYILDGAHRLSVIRAWMTDDWGDKAGTYYERRDKGQILDAARTTRELVKRRIGLFADYEAAHKEFIDLAEQDRAPKQIMGERFARAIFYNRAMVRHQTLAIQWEHGDYESAEQSFLRINRRGQALDPWKATLIEYRRSSYARSIMSIANGEMTVITGQMLRTNSTTN